ncbi:MAG TPA: hypothetical protein VF257_00940 [Solirubrobacteraceae bacterium]
MRRLALIALAVTIVLPSAAQARFSAPEVVAEASGLHRGFVAAADAEGRLTVATRAPRLGFPSRPGPPRLIERRPGGTWSELPTVPGIAAGVYETSIAAAGDGALALAWWVVARSSSIQVAVRKPGGTLSEAIEIAGAEAGGVDHPAIAVDAAGDVLVAYQTRTTASHLRLQGRVALAYRPAGSSSFTEPIVVERGLSNPPVVALAQDGTGIVAWTRRQTLMAVTVGSDGTVGTPMRVARSVLGRPVVAAGRGSAASIAYRVNETASDGKRRPARIRYSLRVLSRASAGPFARPRSVFRGAQIGRGLALAADEQGRATLAWTGVAAATTGAVPSRVWIAAGRVGRSFGRPRAVAPHDDPGGESIAVAARNGHVALAWRLAAPERSTGVQVAAGRWNEGLEPELIPTDPPVERPVVVVTGSGHTSVLWRAGKLWVSSGP